MNPEEYQRAKRANDRAGLFLIVVFLVWLPIYLLGVRPLINSWLAQYIHSYPAAFHLIPIFAVPGLVGWFIKNKYPAPPKPTSGGIAP
jgi:hypothetical protein